MPRPKGANNEEWIQVEKYYSRLSGSTPHNACKRDVARRMRKKEQQHDGKYVEEADEVTVTVFKEEREIILKRQKRRA